MLRFKLAGYAAFALMLVVSHARSDDNPKDPLAMVEDPRVAKLISQLSDADPAVRNGAVERLINLRGSAWPALRRKLESASPQVRTEIDRVLLHVSWLQSDDDEAVVEVFQQYATLDAESRGERIRQAWGPNIEQPPPTRALLRILLNDPSTSVRWRAANTMRIAFDEVERAQARGEAVLDQKKQELTSLKRQILDLVDGTKSEPNAYTVPLRNAPLIAIAGLSCRKEPARCAQMLEMALTMEQDQPTEFRGQMDFVFTWLADRAMTIRQHARAIQLLRERADRTECEMVGDIPDAVMDLFAEQADHGPEAGFADDLRMYEEYLTHPEMMYALSQLASRSGHPVFARLAGDAALVLGGISAENHFNAGQFLERRQWNLAAERELKCCLEMPDAFAPNISPAIVYMRLSEVAADRTDDLAAARYLETGLQQDTSGIANFSPDGKRTAWSPDPYWMKVNDFRLRYAQQTNDQPATREYLNKLLADDGGEKTLKTWPGMAADIVPALQSAGKDKQADLIFESAAAVLEKQMNDSPDLPMAKNNLAWLFACSNKRLDEAKMLIAKAIEQAPEEGASWDTQAEILMRLGQPAKAAQSEIKACELKPDDVYMVKQLARFKDAAAKQSH